MTADTTPESLLEYTPTDREFRDWIVVVDTIGGHGGESIRRFDRWLAAHDAEVARKALTDAAGEIERIVNDAEVAETVAFPPGTVGLGAAIDRRDRMLESPEDWLRARAEQIGEK